MTITKTLLVVFIILGLVLIEIVTWAVFSRTMSNDDNWEIVLKKNVGKLY